MRRKLRKSSAQGNFTPAFAKPMLYAVLFMRCVFFTRCVCKYAGEMGEIYSFFSEGKKREGKCSFCIFLTEALGKIQNVHFPLRWAFLFVLFRISQECKFWTEEYCLQTEEYKFQTLQYNIQM